MSAATELRSQLTGLTIPITGYPLSLGRISAPTLAIWQESIDRSEEFGLSRYVVTIAAWVIISTEDMNAAVAVLDPILNDVLTELQAIKWVDWSRVEWLELPAAAAVGYKIKLTAISEPVISGG